MPALISQMVIALKRLRARLPDGGCVEVRSAPVSSPRPSTKLPGFAHRRRHHHDPHQLGTDSAGPTHRAPAAPAAPARIWPPCRTIARRASTPRTRSTPIGTRPATRKSATPRNKHLTWASRTLSNQLGFYSFPAPRSARLEPPSPRATTHPR